MNGTPRYPMDDNSLRRFEDKFQAQTNGCWIWNAYLSQGGYGYFRYERVLECAHRVAYQQYVGPIAEGLQLDHLCRNRACVNPAHLEPVTMAENLARGIHVNRSKTHCLEGHPYSGENLIRTKSGGRGCRECKKRYQREYEIRRALHDSSAAKLKGIA